MDPQRKTIASVIGILSIVSSLVFWIETAMAKALGRVPGWIDVGLDGWVAGWVFGLLLAVFAAFLWPKRWWLALLVPVLSFFAAFFASMGHVEW